MAAETVESYELIPPEGDPNVGKEIFKLVGEVINDKVSQGLHTKWENHYLLSRNRPWKEYREDVPLMTANLLHTHRQRTCNTLTDNSPAFNMAKIGAIAEENDEVFTDLQRTVEHWWRETEQQSHFSRSVTMGEMHGCAIEKVIFDPDLEYGIGEVRTVNVDPYHFGVYPVTVMDSQDAEANFHFYPMALRQVRRQWPDKAAKIFPDSELVKELGGDRRMLIGEQSNTGLLQRVYSMAASLFGSDKQDANDDQVLVVECWVKDYSTSEVEEIDESGNVTVISTPKYPGHIRRITVCSGGNVVLEDRGNPNVNQTLPPEQARNTYLFDKFPFTIVQSIDDSCTIWGSSDWEQLEGLHREFQKTLSQFSYAKNKAVRPKIINPLTSGVGNEEFTNSFGILNPATAELGAGIRYLEMSNQGLMAEVSNSLNIIRELFFLVAGTFEMEQAQSPGNSVTAYKAIAALLEHAATMMRGKIRSYQKLIRERGRMYLSHVMNFYTEDRWISYEEDGETQTAMVRGDQMIVPTKLTVVSGSTLPKSKMQQRDEALELFRAGGIDQVELLRVLEWPNRAEVIKRLQAGPIGEIVERLLKVGLDKQTAQLMQQIGQMDDKEFDKALREGSLPQLAMPTQETGDPGAAMEQQIQQAKVGRAIAEKDLAVEKVLSERIDQQIRIKGVEFDERKLELERAKVAADIKQREKEPVMPSNNRPGYNERGMVSDNVA